jgi:hypothetical protein
MAAAARALEASSLVAIDFRCHGRVPRLRRDASARASALFRTLATSGLRCALAVASLLPGRLFLDRTATAPFLAWRLTRCRQQVQATLREFAHSTT